MAILAFPQWQTITSEMRILLGLLSQFHFIESFYLAGGTGLALQIGHPQSIDFDFFSITETHEEFSNSAIIKALSLTNVQVIENVPGNLLLVIDGIRTGFFGYGYPLIEETTLVNGIHLGSLTDIGLMKCDALISRGSRKDFYDLYYISRTIPISTLLDAGVKKYHHIRDFPLMVLESMTLFENADRDIQPTIFEGVTWNQVKQFFVDQTELLNSRWFG